LSVKLVEKEIIRFLRSDEPQVLCIQGEWGVGKTFGWHDLVKKAKERGDISEDAYAYVSLFGVNSLDKLKFTIFENKVGKNAIGVDPSVETFKTNAGSLLGAARKKILGPLFSTPEVSGYAAALQSLAYLSVQNMLICFDDFERKSNELPVKDVLGLVSNLSEQRQCKVVLILNEDGFNNSDQEDFKKYHEKVIDTSITYAPAPKECADIAIKNLDAPGMARLHDAVVRLGLSNIRIITKVRRLVERIAPTLEPFAPGVLDQAVDTLTVMGWSVYDKDNAPDEEFLLHTRGKKYYGELFDAVDEPEREKSWNEVLDKFGYALADELDAAIMDGLKRGCFDDAVIVEQATALNERLEAAGAEFSLRNVWRLYHDTFSNNEAELASALHTGYQEHVNHVSPGSLSAAMNILELLGEEVKAADILNAYIKHNKDRRKAFDLSQYVFAGDVTNDDLRAAFVKQYGSYTVDRPPFETLVHISEHNSWSEADIALLSTLSAVDFYNMFNENKGDALEDAIKQCLNFGNMVSEDQSLKQIASRAREALQRIAGEGALNARRVKTKYGIDPPEEG